MKEHHIIYVPGLNDQSMFNRAVTKVIKGPTGLGRDGIKVDVFEPKWKQKSNFAPELKRIVQIIDELAEQGDVSLVGQSAGGSVVLNAYTERSARVTGVVNVGGRLRSGQHVYRTLKRAAEKDPGFEEFVLMFQEREKNLTAEERKKIMTIRPFLDEGVPASTVSLEGATNVSVPVIGHIIGGISICTIYANKVLDFLEGLRR